MKKKVNKKVNVKKVVVKKQRAAVSKPKAKKPVAKKPVVDDPLNSKAAISDLRKQYAALAKINIQRAIVLEAISKKEAELAEVLDLNMSKVEDRSNENLLKKLSVPTKPSTSLTPTLGAPIVDDPFTVKASSIRKDDGLNAIACKY